MRLADALRYELEALRRREGWSQAELARRLGLTQSAISHWLRGDRGQRLFDRLLSIANLFGESLPELFARLERRVRAAAEDGSDGGDGSPPPPSTPLPPRLRR